jgi:hypothetical protein
MENGQSHSACPHGAAMELHTEITGRCESAS